MDSLVDVQRSFVIGVNSGVAEAVNHFFDEVDEKETAAKEDFGCRNAAEVVACTFDAFTNLKKSNQIILHINKT